MEKIKWAELTDKDKTALVLEHVMGYCVLEQTTKGYDIPDLTRSTLPVGFDWPIASWNTDCECWAYKDIGDNRVTLFEPLHDWDDAWPILFKMIEWFALRRGDPLLFGPYEDAMEFLLNGHSLWLEIDPVSDLFDIVRTWTPERICIAALKATGLEIETNERD